MPVYGGSSASGTRKIQRQAAVQRGVSPASIAEAAAATRGLYTPSYAGGSAPVGSPYAAPSSPTSTTKSTRVHVPSTKQRVKRSQKAAHTIRGQKTKPVTQTDIRERTDKLAKRLGLSERDQTRISNKIARGAKPKAFSPKETHYLNATLLAPSKHDVKAKLEHAVAKAQPTYSGLAPDQAKVLTTVLSTGAKHGATHKELLAATETGIVESGLRNLSGGDADSRGWRQERTSIYGANAPMNVKGAAKRFFQESVSDTRGTRGKGQTAGQLAQTIQGSAYPDRYDEAKSQAKPLLHDFLSAKSKAVPKALKQEAKQVLGAEKTHQVITGQMKPSGPVPKKTVTRFQAIVDEAKKIDSAKLPYVWGGGHVAGKVPGPRNISGYDCSGVVSRVLQSAGVKLPGGITSGELAQSPALKPGPGAVTVYANGEHTFMKIGNRYFGTSHANPGGGAGFIPTSYEQGEATSGAYTVKHVPGLGSDVARRMGVRLSGSGSVSSPGMSYSSDGTSATITDGVVKDTPGSSEKPIRFQPNPQRQLAHRRKALLNEIIARKPAPILPKKNAKPVVRAATPTKVTLAL